jgi:hypothetical protein
MVLIFVGVISKLKEKFHVEILPLSQSVIPINTLNVQKKNSFHSTLSILDTGAEQFSGIMTYNKAYFTDKCNSTFSMSLKVVGKYRVSNTVI